MHLVTYVNYFLTLIYVGFSLIYLRCLFPFIFFKQQIQNGTNYPYKAYFFRWNYFSYVAKLIRFYFVNCVLFGPFAQSDSKTFSFQLESVAW